MKALNVLKVLDRLVIKYDPDGELNSEYGLNFSYNNYCYTESLSLGNIELWDSESDGYSDYSTDTNYTEDDIFRICENRIKVVVGVLYARSKD